MLLDEPKVNAPKVKRALEQQYGINISVKTVQRIACDLEYLWTKPWHTDVLTSPQKKKRDIFCEDLLQLTEQQLLETIS